MRQTARFLQILLLILYPVAAHVAVYLHQPNLALIPLLLLTAIHFGGLTRLFILIAISILFITNNSFILLYFPPVIISFILLIVFAKTLLPNQEPLITMLARVIYSDTGPEVQAYTRKVTKVWCLFFFAMFLESTLLALFADAKTWSLFCNILNYIFIAVLFLLEYIYRKFKFKNENSFIFFLKRMIQTDIKQLVQQQKIIKIPLFAHKDIHAVFAFQHGKAISCLDFLNDVNTVMQQLSSELYLINLCEDRYHFAVLFAAALLKKIITLLPNNRSPQAIAELQKNFPNSFCLNDAHLSTYLQKTNQAIANPGAIPEIESTQLVAILYTSGSTGTPVPCKKYWGELVNHCAYTAKALMLEKHENICIVATVSPQHMYGLEHSVILPMQMGYTLCAEKPFFMDDIRMSLQKKDYDLVLFSTPLQLKQCVNTDAIFPAIRLLVSSTATLETALAIQIEKKFNTSLYEIYGCTEAGCIATRLSARTEKWTLSTDYHLQNENGYFLLKPENKIKLLDDIDQIDDRHFLLRGRLEDNINIAGNRMSLADLNIKLTSIPGIQDGIFYLLAPDSMTARLIAFVVTEKLTDEEIKSALRQMLNPVFLPRKIIKLEKLPRNELGKIDATVIEKLASSIERASGC